MLISALGLSVGCSGGKKKILDLVPEPVGPPFAVLVELDEPPPISGAEVQGVAGDWMLQNERLAVVVQGLGNQSGFALSGGNIIDAAPTGGPDLLGGTFLYLNDRFGRQAVYTSLESDASDTTGVSLVARGWDSEEYNLRIDTRFSLRPGWDFVEIRTEVHNTGPDTVLSYELGDGIEWGRARSYAPGPGRNLPGTREPIAFLTGSAGGTAYAWWSPEGPLTGPHALAWSDPIVKTVDLFPDSKATYVRRLNVIRGSAAAACGRAWSMAGTETVSGVVTVRNLEGAPVGGAGIEAFDSSGESFGWGETGPNGRLVLALPPGTYDLEIRHPRRSPVTRKNVRFRADNAPEIEIELEEPGHLTLVAGDGHGNPSPARWIFEGTGDTPTPDLGPAYDASGAGPYVFAATGETKTDIPPGSYRVTASRGPAYEIWQTDLDVLSGEEAVLNAELMRVPIPEGWVSADLHVHSLKSPDCGVSLPDRARALVCEGVDWFAASDHDFRTDFSPVLDSLSLGAPLNVLVSEEITSFHFGHFNAFPLEIVPGAPGRGAVQILGASPERVFTGLRREREDMIIQVNHPRSSSSGYFAMVEDPLLHDFELLEIVNGRQGSIEGPWEDWMALLRSGRRVVGVGNSDSHFLVGQEVGYPRNYIQIAPAHASDPDSLLRALRQGKVVAGYGPFIEFTLEGAGIGSTVVRSKGKLSGHIRVMAPAWIDVSEVAVYVDGVEQIVFRIKDRERVVRFDEDFDLSLHSSGFVLVKVTGNETMNPVLTESGGWRPVRPLAFTNPIWVELTGSS